MNLVYESVDIARDVYKSIVTRIAVARSRAERGHSVEHPPSIIVLVGNERAAKVPNANAAVFVPCAHIGIISNQTTITY